MSPSNYRDHQPVVIDEFNGLFDQDDPQSTPLDHFQDCRNLQFIGSSSVRTRPGIGISQTVELPLTNVRRIYNYPTNTGNTLIALTYDYDDDEGSIYHIVNSTTVFGPLLTIAGMTDFAFLPYAGRGYISPFGTFEITGLSDEPLNIQKGLENEFLYVYAGDGTSARKAAGTPLTGNMTIANGAAGFTDPGLHIFGIVGETASGYLTPPGALETFTTSANSSVSFGNVPTGGGEFVKRHLVATKVITGYNGNLEGYELFFVPNATINNDTDTFLNNISFFDQDLLDDASHLLENYSEIPAGASLCLYHDRLVLTTTFDDPGIALVSEIGEPEAIDQIDGIVAPPPDGNPLTNCQELRDILYLFKRSKTISYADNGDIPSSWLPVVVDTALGTSVHGIATVLDSGGTSVDYLIICTYQGVTMFNGRYINPELTWKMYNYWQNLNRNLFGVIQIVNDPVRKWLLIIIPNGAVLHGNYANGMDAKKIRWCPWTFACQMNTVAIADNSEVIFGADINITFPES